MADQGLGSGNELPTLPTDDPDTPPVSDPMVTSAGRPPGIALTKTLVSGNPARLDELVTFTLSITNTGHATLVTIPMTDAHSGAYLGFAHAVLAPDEIRQPANGETGQVIWHDLVAHSGLLMPGAMIQVQLVMTASAATPETPNHMFIQNAVDENGNWLSAFATAPVAIVQDPAAIDLLYSRTAS
jgi:hypothetical protein